MPRFYKMLGLVGDSSQGTWCAFNKAWINRIINPVDMLLGRMDELLELAYQGEIPPYYIPFFMSFNTDLARYKSIIQNQSPVATFGTLMLFDSLEVRNTLSFIGYISKSLIKDINELSRKNDNIQPIDEGLTYLWQIPPLPPDIATNTYSVTCKYVHDQIESPWIGTWILGESFLDDVSSYAADISGITNSHITNIVDLFDYLVVHDMIRQPDPSKDFEQIIDEWLPMLTKLRQGKHLSQQLTKKLILKGIV